MATTYDIRVNATQAERELNKLQDSLSGVSNLFGKLQTAIAGIGIASFISNTIQSAAALDDLANSTGIALQNIIGFSKAITDFGGSAEGAATGIARFSNFIQDAADGNKKAQDTILGLGLSLDDLRGKSDADILRATITGLAQMQDRTKAMTIGMQIFGKSFATVSFGEVNANLEEYIQKSLRQTDAVKAAAAADESFGRALDNLKSIVLGIIEPFTKFIGSLKPETIEAFVRTIVNLAMVLAGLKVISVISGMLTTLAAAVVTANTSMRGFIATMAAAQWQSFKDTLGYMITGLLGIKNAAQVASGGLGMFGASLAFIVKGFLRLIPYVGIAMIAFDALSSLVETFTGKGIIAWADQAGKALANLAGIEYQTGEEKKKLADAAEKLKEKQLEQAQATREVVDALEKEKTALDNTLKAYRSANSEANRRYELETKAISLSEKQKLLDQERFSAESKYNQEMQKLEQQLQEKRKGSDSDKAMVPAIQAAMGKLTAAYREQIGAIDGLVASRVKETQANELKLFQTRSMLENEQRLKDLQLEIANTGLPQLIQKYNSLDDATRRSAESAIAAEEARRKEKLNPSEIQAYYDAAKAGVEGLKEATTRLTQAQQQYNLSQFGIRERIQLENDLQKIKDDTAKITMTEMQKKEYDLVASARARAKAEIEAEEARRGSRLSAAEAQQYYDTANAGVRSLIDQQRQLNDSSRSFGTGWKNAFQEYADNATNAATQARDIFQKTTKGMEDLIVNFAKTGKFEFKGFLNSILEDLLRSQVRQLIAQTFGSIGGGGGGGGGSSLIGSLLGFANGGIIPTNKPVLVGERGPELLVGAAGNRVIPNEQIGGNVTYNINAVDAMSFKQMIAQDPGFIHAVAMQGGKGIPSRR